MKILSILNAQKKGDGKPHVAAWILTHPHSDHIGAFSDMSSLYYDSIILDRVIYNFINDDLMAASDSKALISKSGIYTNFRNALASQNKWRYTEIIKPHTGDVLYIDGVKIEILHTHEEVFPKNDDLLYNNANTMAFMMEAAGKKIAITGDKSGTYMLAMANWYGSNLKCDILQPVHHGTTHGKVETYSKMNPEIALWCSYDPKLAGYINNDYNKWLLANVPVHYYADKGTVSLSLLTMQKVS